MTRYRSRLVFLSSLVFVLAMSSASPVFAEDAAPSSPGLLLAKRGDDLLKEGDVAAAAKAYLAAARAEPANKAYADRAMVLRSAERLRRFVEGDDRSSRWTTAVVTLHAFYLDSGLPWKALDIDRKAHARLDNAGSAVLLAETLLVLQHDREAAELLVARPSPTFHERALLGIALLRQGKREDGLRLVGSLEPPQNATPSQLQDAARARTLAGAYDAAFALLRRSFEQTPSRALEASRRRVTGNVDFAAVKDLPAFRAVLQTASKVPETCSGGASCGSCPNRGKCGKN